MRSEFPKAVRAQALIVLTSLLAWILGAYAASQHITSKASGPSTLQLNITQQPLADALRVFAEQTGLSVAFRTEDIDPSVMAQPVIGRYTPEAALARLLERSNLRAFRVTEGLIAVKTVHQRADVKPLMRESLGVPVSTQSQIRDAPEEAHKGPFPAREERAKTNPDVRSASADH